MSAGEKPHVFHRLPRGKHDHSILIPRSRQGVWFAVWERRSLSRVPHSGESTRHLY
ncbi:hypothetical protein F9C07_6463 [Aspergillus flavus]|uniref:Uncharacterized protein n=1 Tax=Aspergillus flavus (strain ATCC 200026 / FGSC A1120 / IAM 13836 / NRRL 3357 / JCM 12722 / SRRC 167) TaxID=332952 RepID=A0A7U2MHN9_ASPFN|nr:hypothetical protein F9C07_6463 [Aspergillus flavus]